MFWSKALIDGAIISVVICSWISVILKVNPRYEMKSYPSQIVSSVAPQTKAEKKGLLRMALPMLAIVVIYLIFTIYSTYKNVVGAFPYLFLHVFVVFMIWNTADLLILDWLIFCWINPDFMIIPGTKGNPAYKDYRFHFIGFIKGIVLAIIFAVLIATIVYVPWGRFV